MITYRDYEIERSGAPQFPYEFAHKDFDGPEDKRIGNARTEEDAKRQIDEQIEDSESRTALPNKPMKPNHTPGTWHAHDGQIYPEETGKTLALIPYFDAENKEQIANALLIAAAPDLLKALQMALEYRLQTHHGDDKLLATLRAALTKAGVTP